MERIVNKARNFKEAEAWDMLQQITMTPQERMEVARKLKERVYGTYTKDVRECHRKK